ncbi:MAG: zinc-ribbon domain containing protein [bacterium]|nr:zinc-ribbon domain containing protein [bacterium]
MDEGLRSRTVTPASVMAVPLSPLYLICVDCDEEFVFPVSAQEYFIEQGYQHHPKRCKSCHNRHKRGDRSENGR